MVLEDVAARAGLLVEGAPVLDPDRLGHRDLHVVHVAPVPERLEDAVPEPEDHQVPDGLLAQVVVDPVDLRLAEDLADLAVEADRRVEVAPERLLDDDPAPAAAVDLVVEAAPPELADDLGEGRGLGGEVEQAVAAGPVLGVDLVEALDEAVVHRVVGEVALVVDDPLQELALPPSASGTPAVLLRATRRRRSGRCRRRRAGARPRPASSPGAAGSCATAGPAPGRPCDGRGRRSRRTAR